MENLEETLIEIIETYWDAAGGTGILEASKVVFSQADFRIEGSLKESPNIYAQLLNIRREQDTDTLHYANIAVGIIFWTKAKTIDDLKTAKDTFWDMIELVYKIVNNTSYKPAGWVHMLSKNLTVIISDLVPPVLEAVLVVEAKFDWSVS